MNAHRQHYFEANAAAASAAVAVPDPRGIFAVVLVVALLAAFGLYSLVELSLKPPAITAPMRTPHAEAFNLVPLDHAVQEARIEGFRAGVSTATEEGCQQATLTTPIGAR